LSERRFPTVVFIAPSAYPLGGVADWLDYTMAGLSGRGWTCRLCLVHGSGHDVDRYLKRHPWKDPMAVFNPTGSREGRIRELGAAIDGCRADVVVSVNLVDVYESVRRGRVRQAGCFPKVVHGEP